MTIIYKNIFGNCYVSTKFLRINSKCISLSSYRIWENSFNIKGSSTLVHIICICLKCILVCIQVATYICLENGISCICLVFNTRQIMETDILIFYRMEQRCITNDIPCPEFNLVGGFCYVKCCHKTPCKLISRGKSTCQSLPVFTVFYCIVNNSIQTCGTFVFASKC